MAEYSEKNPRRYGRKLEDHQLLNTLVMGDVKISVGLAKSTNCNCIAIIRDVF